MTFPLFHHTTPMNPKHLRRTATSVMAGAFDARPPRDVLTSLLNGVGPYKVVEEDGEARRIRKREKKERERERRKAKAAARARERELNPDQTQLSTPNASTSSLPLPQTARNGPSSFWTARPAIHLATIQRSVSVTPPPDMSPLPTPFTPTSTPGPSNSSSVSGTSSKRPRTPYDYEDLDIKPDMVPPRKRRDVVKKGWKGWVEGSPPPSEKLINLDSVPILQERRTRSGKNFDAIGVGKAEWV